MTVAKRFEDLEVWQRSRLYVALEQKYITGAELNPVHVLAELCSKQLARLIRYLESQPNTRRVREDELFYDVQP
jgi:hypothetical protein